MSIFKIIINLPIIIAKLVWRTILITVISFPVSAFVLVPAVNENNIGAIVGFAAIAGGLALIVSIRVWKKSADDYIYNGKWTW